MSKIIHFLKPTTGKVVVTIVLLVLVHVVQILIRAGIVDYWVIGVPFHFEQTWGPCLPEEICYSFNWFLLIIDIIFWYLISCFMVFLWNKYKKKK